jgi:tRNA-2-methylthio-N6-dimethylallyladenosine synthase
MIGHALDVLIEKPGRHQGQIAGKSPYLQPIQMEGSLDRLGDIVRVEIVSLAAIRCLDGFCRTGPRARRFVETIRSFSAVCAARIQASSG